MSLFQFYWIRKTTKRPKWAPTVGRGPPSLVRPTGFVPATPSLAYEGDELRARPPTGR